MKFFYYLLLAGFLTGPLVSIGQPGIKPPAAIIATAPVNDTTNTVEILPGVRKLEFRKINDSTQLQILAGNVKLKQGNTLFYSDSCVINNNIHTFEAWGHVHINDSDTADAYSNHLIYKIDKRVAYLDGSVKLTDGHGSLTTPDLEYDMETKVGIYKHGGTVITKSTVLTSKEGYYYTDLKDVYFKNKVELKDPAYFIKTDSLLYNTEFQTARFIAETYIRDSSGRIIETKEGVYNMQTGRAEFGRRPVVHDKNLYATGNEMMNDDSTGIVQIRGNAIVIDSANHTTVIAGEIFVNNKTNSFLAFKKPLMIVKQEDDSIYISADTLFSARLTDLMVKINSTTKNKTDSLTANTGKDNINKKAPPFLTREKNDSTKLDPLTRPVTINMNGRDSINRPVGPNFNRGKNDSTRPGMPTRPPNNNVIGRKDSINKSIEPVLAIDTKDSTTSDTLSKTNINAISGKDSSNKSVELVKQSIKDSTRSGLLTKPNAINQKDKSNLSVEPNLTKGKNDSLRIITPGGTKMVAINEKDSTNRYFEAFSHVRIFSDSMQAVCDSMFYSFKDSVFRLFDDPVVWSKDSQISGDTILLFTRNNKAELMKIINNSLLVNQMQAEVYNQVKSNRMDGFFKDGSLDSVRASGLAECIYFIQDEDSAYTGINESKSDILDAYFENKALQKVVFRSSVTGTIWPIQQKDPKEMRLTKFRWLDARRPKTKFDLF
ncbi:MAG: OstA-like protein [Chitinophagaceae bacterium]